MEIMNNRLKSIAGITIVELMSTVVVIGIISAAAAPSFNRAVQRIKFRSETKNLVSTLRMARSQAISEKAPYGIYYDATNRTVTTFKDLTNLANYTFESGSDSVIKVDQLPYDIAYLYASFPNSTVIYEPNGTASASGDIYLLTTDHGIVNTSQVNVLASTGRAKVAYIHNY